MIVSNSEQDRQSEKSAKDSDEAFQNSNRKTKLLSLVSTEETETKPSSLVLPDSSAPQQQSEAAAQRKEQKRQQRERAKGFDKPKYKLKLTALKKQYLSEVHSIHKAVIADNCIAVGFIPISSDCLAVAVFGEDTQPVFFVDVSDDNIKRLIFKLGRRGEPIYQQDIFDAAEEIGVPCLNKAEEAAQ